MTDFPTLSYTSAREIPTLLYTWSLKKVPLSCGASPYRPLQGVTPPGCLDILWHYTVWKLLILLLAHAWYWVSVAKFQPTFRKPLNLLSKHHIWIAREQYFLWYCLLFHVCQSDVWDIFLFWTCRRRTRMCLACETSLSLSWNCIWLGQPNKLRNSKGGL